MCTMTGEGNIFLYENIYFFIKQLKSGALLPLCSVHQIIGSYLAHISCCIINHELWFNISLAEFVDKVVKNNYR